MGKHRYQFNAHKRSVQNNLQPVLCNTGCERCILTPQFQHLDKIKFIMDFYDNDVNWNKNL